MRITYDTKMNVTPMISFFFIHILFKIYESSAHNEKHRLHKCIQYEKKNNRKEAKVNFIANASFAICKASNAQIEKKEMSREIEKERMKENKS